MSVFQPFYDAIAWLVVHIHGLLAPVFGTNSGASWALAIVLLTVFMRILLIPLFVKQIKSQRAMTALQPQIKALQAKYKNDKNKLNEEMMKLWREAGVNPFMGCLPLLPQIPIFFALFHTLNGLRPSLVNGHYVYPAIHEFTPALVRSAAQAKIFGVPIAAAFNSNAGLLSYLHASSTSTRILCAVLTLLMVATTFLTQRQMLARNAATNNSPMAGQQKVILYILPLLFLVYGYRFPIGVLLYWLTTNVWSLGQQFIVLRRMDAATATSAPAGAPVGPAPGARPERAKPTASTPAPPVRPLPVNGDGGTLPATRRPGQPSPNARRRRKRRR